MKFVSTQKAQALTGLSANTLRRYADQGLIHVIRLPNGDRRFDIESWLAAGSAKPVKTVCYCRVSSAKQRDDLARQVERMRSLYPDAEVVSDIGSGLNFKRKALLALLERLMQGEKLRLVLTHRDRLCRFGFQLFEHLFEKSGGEILVLDPSVGEPKQELVQDLLAILHHFSCRMHGSRSRKNRTSSEDSSVPESPTEAAFQALVRNVSEDVQRDGGVSEFRDEAESPLDGSVETDSGELA